MSEHFPTRDINKLFDGDLDRAVQTALANHYEINGVDEDGGLTLKAPSLIRQSFDALHGMNWVGYISRSLRNAGVPKHDLDEEASQIAVQLLRGRLFSGWNGETPLEARFKVAVKNAVSNVRRRRGNERHVASLSDPGVVAYSRRAMDDEFVAGFTRFVASRLGNDAVVVMKHLLDGGEVKELVGTKKGWTSYRVKKWVREIKDALFAYGAQDAGFAKRLKRAIEAEQETLTKRFAGRTQQA